MQFHKLRFKLLEGHKVYFFPYALLKASTDNSGRDGVYHRDEVEFDLNG